MLIYRHITGSSPHSGENTWEALPAGSCAGSSPHSGENLDPIEINVTPQGSSPHSGENTKKTLYLKGLDPYFLPISFSFNSTANVILQSSILS